MVITKRQITDNYTRLWIDADHAERRALEIWCYQTQCGKKVDWKSFAFKNEGELMMFKLRWAQDLEV